MALLERVATLMRANLNDLIDKAENPEKMLKQVMLDMENQYIQVKTQVAVALADLHLLEKKSRENSDQHLEWMRKAELAVDKHDDELARAALSRALSLRQVSANFEQQIADQRIEVEGLKGALKKLESKLAEAQTKVDLLILRHRRSRAANRARGASRMTDPASAFARMHHKVAREEALGHALGELASDGVNARLEALEFDQQIESMLSEIKTKRSLNA